MIDSAVIDLPQPDSPSSAKVSPRSIVSDNAVDRAHDPLAAVDPGAKVLDLQQRRAHEAAPFGRRAVP